MGIMVTSLGGGVGTANVGVCITILLKHAERNQSVYGKDLLAMSYALIKFCVHLLADL